ncbi:hypothetical protein IPC878_23305 [Pseudomonas aeruginosa]|nr:hypothetical protein APB45_09960 [Pseudomonas aeruginosa]RPV03020.1 hypothetical protein IPC878_23305 [Pseudomonas aeruginosa]
MLDEDKAGVKTVLVRRIRFGLSCYTICHDLTIGNRSYRLVVVTWGQVNPTMPSISKAYREEAFIMTD